MTVGWKQGVVGVGWGGGKEPELPDLNKVNFPAIWPVFGMEGGSLEDCWRCSEKALFLMLFIQNLLIQNQ